MPCSDLHLDCPGLHVTDLLIDPDAITVHAEPSAATAACPDCGHDSDRVHGRYTRRVVDLPVQGRRLALRLKTRRFYCTRRDCRRRIFCERLPGLAAAHARTTGPLADSHRDIGFALGGEAGARLAGRLAMPASPDTLLRLVKSAPDEPAPRPRFIGVDDWAVRKGQDYGTIIIDLERHCVIDVLPGRDGEELKKWLMGHPGVEVIARDRRPAFANAAAEAAPQAEQVADRWHLLKDLLEVVERPFARHPDEIRRATHAGTPEPAPAPAETAGPIPPAQPAGGDICPGQAADRPELTAREQARAAKQKTREERFRLVRDLRTQGLSLRQIARQLRMSCRAVLRYLREPKCPDWNAGKSEPIAWGKANPVAPLGPGTETPRSMPALGRPLSGRGMLIVGRWA